MTNIDMKQMEECEEESWKRQALAVWKNWLNGTEGMCRFN